MLMSLLGASLLLPFPRESTAQDGMAVNPKVITESRDVALPVEGYRLEVTAEGATIASADERGAFYARETLKQLTDADGKVPCCMVKDWPEYPYRSIMIDEGRHFFGKAFMLKTLELMARYKFNTLHWHLTEDQGWRIAIDRYPELARIGATRLETAVRGHFTGKYDGTQYGPHFYTKDEIREVVKRATELKIDIIPEIEMPGHCRSVIAAYPELACPTAKLGRRTCWTDWGICDDVVCVSDPKVLEFYKNVIDEVCELFPGKRFHTGGDEVTGAQWKSCPRCRAKMRELGFTNVMQLQGWFTQQIYEYLTDVKGREFGGWSAVFSNGTRLDPKKCYAPGGCENNQVWCAMAGYKTVASPVEYMYWDFNQGLNDADKVVYGTWWPGSITLSDVYGFDPRRGVPSAAAKNIIGGESHNWAEYSYTVPELEWKIWPRAIALAQALWNPQGGYSYQERFLPAVKKHIARLRNEGVNCADAFEGYSCATTGGASVDNQILKQD